MPGPAIETAEPRDIEAIRALLVDLGLPASDLGAASQHFIVAREGGSLVGCVGLEIHGSAALLRSLAVEPARQGAGVGRALYRRALAEARSRGVTALYLLTTTADRYFAREGFATIGREEVPAAVRASAEFGALCPASAACMWKPI